MLYCLGIFERGFKRMKGNEFSYDKIGLPVLPKQTVDYSMIPVLNRYAPFVRLQLLPMTPLERAEFVLIDAYNKVYDERSAEDKQKINHAIRVSECLGTDEEKIVALFHEGPEEGIIDLEELRDFGLSIEGLNAIEALTSDEKRYPKYSDFINALIESRNLIALKVKKASLLDKNAQILQNSNLEEEEKVEIIKKREIYLRKIDLAIKKIQLENLNEQIALQEAEFNHSL